MNWRIFNDPANVQIPVNMARVNFVEYCYTTQVPIVPNGRAKLIFGKDHYLEVLADEVFRHHIEDFLIQVRKP